MKNVIILVAIIVAMASQVAKADQFVSADCESDDSRVSVYYGATDPDLVGLGLRMHWDSSEITYSHTDDVLEHSYFGSYGPVNDWKDYDDDVSTDKFIFIGWVDWGSPPSWPGLYATKLFDLVHLDTGGSVGNVGFSVIDNAIMHDILWTGC